MTDTRDDQPDYRQPRTTRATMPEWARAKDGSRPDPELKKLCQQLRRKLFGDHDSEAA